MTWNAALDGVGVALTAANSPLCSPGDTAWAPACADTGPIVITSSAETPGTRRPAFTFSTPFAPFHDH